MAPARPSPLHFELEICGWAHQPKVRGKEQFPQDFLVSLLTIPGAARTAAVRTKPSLKLNAEALKYQK